MDHYATLNCFVGGHQCGLSNVRDTRALTPLFSAVVTQTHASSCWPWKGPFDTNRWCRLEAAVAWGSTLDTRTPSLRTCCEPACDAGSPLVELPVDFMFTDGSADATVFDPCLQAHIYTLAARQRLTNRRWRFRCERRLASAWPGRMQYKYTLNLWSRLELRLSVWH
jgi:hypothetical protein